jgi:hypothetical protein
MRRRIKKSLFLLWWISVFVSGCVPDASHDNPLDPASPAFSNSGTLLGNVLSYYQPYTGIAGVLVTAQPSGVSTVTNAAGAFAMNGIPAGPLRIVVSRTGYLTDSVNTNATIGVNASVDIHMDALPAVGTCQVLTRKIDQWWPRASYAAVVNGLVSDPDGSGDIVGVTLQVDTMRLAMSYLPDLQLYQATIDAANLPEGSIDWLVGKSFALMVRDKVGGTTTGKSFAVTRVIQDAPIPIVPTALDTASASPQFFWAQPTLLFPYTYKIELFRIDQGVPALVWSVSNLSSSLSDYQYTGQLVIGTYYWTISVVDEFGNLSRSKEASFVVIGP